jgi:hypothetical protein
MVASSLRRIGCRIAYAGAFAAVSLGAVNGEVVTGLETTTDWLTGLCVLGVGAAVVVMLHALLARD